MKRSANVHLGLLLAVAACARDRHCVDDEQNVVDDELCEASARQTAAANGQLAADALADGGVLLDDGGVALQLSDGGLGSPYVSHRPHYFFWYGGAVRSGRVWGGSAFRSGGSWGGSSVHSTGGVSRGGFGSTGAAHGGSSS